MSLIINFLGILVIIVKNSFATVTNWSDISVVTPGTFLSDVTTVAKASCVTRGT